MDETKKPFQDCATNGKRKALAERYTQYLVGQNPKESSFVVNLNGAWGTGKTFFVTEWKRLVESEELNHVAIKIDAWESDYLDDPLAVIVAEVIDQLGKAAPQHDPAFRNAERTVASNIVKLGKDLLPMLAKVVGKHTLGESVSEDLINLIGQATGSATNFSKAQNDLNLGNLGLEVVRQHNRHKEFKEQFKKELSYLVELATKDKNKKLFVFIDELDRCRPTYAIEMLETIKHLFDIPNFVFVLSTDTDQLQHSIKAVYGANFDSYEYLSRFFEQRLTLPEPNYFEFLTAERMFETGNEFQQLMTLPAINSIEALRAAVAMICERNQASLSLRRVKQICMQLQVVINSTLLRKNYYSIFSLIGLIFGKALYNGLDKPTDKLERAKLGFMGSTQSGSPSFSSFTVYKLLQRHPQNESSKNLEEIISTCTEALSQLSAQKPTWHLIHEEELQKGVKYLQDELKILPIKPTQIEDRITDIRNSSEDNFITDDAELLKVIEELNIDFDTLKGENS